MPELQRRTRRGSPTQECSRTNHLMVGTSEFANLVDLTEWPADNRVVVHQLLHLASRRTCSQDSSHSSLTSP